MAYIVLVNPAVLADAGVPLPAVTAATCLSAAFRSILMGIVARYPIALAPGMGLNAYFTYTVCIKMHVPWQTALGAVFLSGVIFLSSPLGIRQMILRAIPHQLYAAVAGRHRPVHRLHRLSARGPGGARPQHAGRHGQHPQSHRLSRALRPDSHGGPRNPEGERLHPHRRAHRHRPCLGVAPGALDAVDGRHSAR
jgi:hypothetical protein